MNKWKSTYIQTGKVTWIKNGWRFILKLSFSLALIGLVLFFVDFREVGKIIINLDPLYLLAAIGLIFLDRALMAYKWDLLLKAVDIRIPVFHLFRIYIIAPLSGIILPSTIGGDVFRLYCLSRYKVSNSAVFASIVIERVIGLIAILLLASFSLGLGFYFMKDTQFNFTMISWVLLICFIAVVGVIVMLLSRGLGGFIDNLASRFAAYPFIGKLNRIYVLCGSYGNHLITLGTVFIWTLVEQMAPIIGNFLLIKAFHINVSFLELVIIIPLIILAIRLPISLDGIGVQEGLYLALFGLVGVSASEAFLLSTVYY